MCDIKTTVVGSYPMPVWLAGMPTRTNLHDALLVVLKTQERAGIDVIADGELSRFDCGFWMLHRSVADRKKAALVAGRDLYCG